VRLDRAWIAAHIPHAGAMCLLDEVVDWTPREIRCRTDSHRAADNPLRAHGRLGAANGIEYAAQAMAVHGALLGAAVPTAARPGLLASARGVSMSVERLDDVPGSLLVHASYVHGDATMVLYEFSVADAARTLISGRATIAFVRSPAGPTVESARR
jgi:predicted hotdog family 3-hydroxylacyl-ACP dehydratase